MRGCFELSASGGGTGPPLGGWVSPDSNTIAGTVLAVQDDLTQAPDAATESLILVYTD
jgi:hypothetical protein